MLPTKIIWVSRKIKVIVFSKLVKDYKVFFDQNEGFCEIKKLDINKTKIWYFQSIISSKLSAIVSRVEQKHSCSLKPNKNIKC